MPKFITNKEYMNQFQQSVDKAGQERIVLKIYLNKQFQKLNQLIETISNETFWQVFPEILGIDAKLTLLTEMISFDDFSNEEIIRIVENDYQDYFKELCGYDLKMKDKYSMIFNLV
ncbi:MULTISPECIES: DUF7006 family protein [Enterococcus]|uniref:DUF7006 family protein n=1 Tax=Enterococcus TaxID=1350 RepID=UPI000EAEDCB7|nr:MULTISPECIES: hypothetical protein [Enterococcus]AYJ46804.1 hypothetical protein D8N35_17565 [Enterococcus casseliflavus]MBS5815987.1 hypothetical protein [Enterococcus casseliflavus]MBX9117689.1 hypothetical protein [Enterococcus casseliflavus]MBX9128266.1 hypothetical protein [Enterococcus casseliflavus]MCD4963712.1 hypothetical protein [Enterococcus casseliflavus]